MGNGSRKIILIGIIVIIIAFVMTMAGRGTADSSLPSYSSENRVEVVENNSNEGQDIETFIYTDDENSFFTVHSIRMDAGKPGRLYQFYPSTNRYGCSDPGVGLRSFRK